MLQCDRFLRFSFQSDQGSKNESLVMALVYSGLRQLVHTLFCFGAMCSILNSQEPLRTLVNARNQFVSELKKSGFFFRTEEHFGSRNQAWETQVLGDFFVSRLGGPNADTPFDDRIYVKGPSSAFAVFVVKNANGGEAYSLIEMVNASTEIAPDSNLSLGIGTSIDDIAAYPWRFRGKGLEDFAKMYNQVSWTKSNDGEIVLEYSDPKNTKDLARTKKFVEIEGQIVFRESTGWKPDLSSWTGEAYDSNGNKTEAAKICRKYFSTADEFGHGKFEDGKLLEDTDVWTNVFTTRTEPNLPYGERAAWGRKEIDKAIFTPEYYGLLPPPTGGINWFLWTAVSVNVLVIGVGLWLRRNVRNA